MAETICSPQITSPSHPSSTDLHPLFRRTTVVEHRCRLRNFSTPDTARHRSESMLKHGPGSSVVRERGRFARDLRIAFSRDAQRPTLVLKLVALEEIRVTRRFVGNGNRSSGYFESELWATCLD
jgi:hypothetical protein